MLLLTRDKLPPLCSERPGINLRSLSPTYLSKQPECRGNWFSAESIAHLSLKSSVKSYFQISFFGALADFYRWSLWSTIWQDCRLKYIKHLGLRQYGMLAFT
jgi:hypothetical protein